MFKITFIKFVAFFWKARNETDNPKGNARVTPKENSTVPPSPFTPQNFLQKEVKRRKIFTAEVSMKINALSASMYTIPKQLNKSQRIFSFGTPNHLLGEEIIAACTSKLIVFTIHAR